MLKTILNIATNRMREPSSWGGIAVLLALFGLSNEEASAITDVLAAVTAAASLFLSEPGSSNE